MFSSQRRTSTCDVSLEKLSIVASDFIILAKAKNDVTSLKREHWEVEDAGETGGRKRTPSGWREARTWSSSEEAGHAALSSCNRETNSGNYMRDRPWRKQSSVWIDGVVRRASGQGPRFPACRKRGVLILRLNARLKGMPLKSVTCGEEVKKSEPEDENLANKASHTPASTDFFARSWPLDSHL